MQEVVSASQDDVTFQTRGLTLLWAVALFGLMAVTWPLWTPLRSVPRVPALEFLGYLPPVIDFALLSVLISGCLLVLKSRGADRPALWLLAAFVILLACDQLRWQPWAYHLLLWGGVLALASGSGAIGLLRALAISIYAYSAIAKLDLEFASTLGSQLVASLLSTVGIDASVIPEPAMLALALAMPTAEALAALLLVFNRTRKQGLWLVTAMHLMAVLALSPIGLNHRPAVLIWNVVFLAQAWLLFSRSAGEMTCKPRFQLNIAMLIVCIAILGPLTRPLGVWDRWPSWGLYAPGGERTEVYVHRSAIARLPDSLPAPKGNADAGWRRLELDRWMLEETYAPLYPQRRTTIAITLWLQQQARLGDFVQVVLSSPADRLTGERTAETLVGAKSIKQHRKRYLVNARAFANQP